MTGAVVASATRTMRRCGPYGPAVSHAGPRHPGGDFSGAFDINAPGQVVGFSHTASGVISRPLDRNATGVTVQDLGTLAGFQRGQGISDEGRSWATPPRPRARTTRPVDRNAAASRCRISALWRNSSVARGINDEGRSWATPPRPAGGRRDHARPWIVTPGGVTVRIWHPGGTSSVAFGIMPGANRGLQHRPCGRLDRDA